MKACLPKRHEEKRERERQTLGPLAPFFMFFPPPPGPALCKLGWPGGLFVLPEVLTLVLGPSFIPFSWVFSFLCLFSSVQFSSVAQSCPTLCDPMNQIFVTDSKVGDRWASGWTFTISQPPFTFPETRNRWAPVLEFTISLLFALQNGSNNRNRKTG